MRDVQEAAELRVPRLRRPLGDVRRDGEHCAPQLAGERDAFRARKAAGETMDVDRQGVRLLPHFQLVIVLHDGNLRRHSGRL